jgi:hypothetical protein
MAAIAIPRMVNTSFKFQVTYQLAIGNRQWSIVNGQSSMVNRQWSIVNRQSSMVNGQSSIGLPPLKHGFPFLKERLHSFVLVFRREAERKEINFPTQALIEI